MNSARLHRPCNLGCRHRSPRSVEYFRVLIKRKWTVIGCLATIFTIVAIASFKMTPIYEAMGRIAINKPDSNLVNFKDSPNGGGDYSDPTDMDTEVTILQSDLLALQVIKALNLDKMPEFGGRASAVLPIISRPTRCKWIQPEPRPCWADSREACGWR